MAEKSQSPSRRIIRLGYLELLVGGGLLLALLAILILPLLQNSKPSVASPETHCKNNLKQLGLAIHNYHDQYGSFPPAYVADKNGRPVHSWRILILPYIEETALYERYDFDEPWNGPNNIKLQDEMPTAYRCWSFLAGVDTNTLEYRQLSQLSNYAAVTGPDCTFYGSVTSALGDFPDREENTLAIVEVRQHAVHWMSPVDVTPTEWLTDLRRSATQANANHHECVNACFADGSARCLPHDLDEQLVNAMVTRSGGEEVRSDF